MSKPSMVRSINGFQFTLFFKLMHLTLRTIILSLEENSLKTVQTRKITFYVSRKEKTQRIWGLRYVECEAAVLWSEFRSDCELRLADFNRNKSFLTRWKLTCTDFNTTQVLSILMKQHTYILLIFYIICWVCSLKLNLTSPGWNSINILVLLTSAFSLIRQNVIPSCTVFMNPYPSCVA